MANPWDNDPIYKPLAKSSAPAGNPWDNDPIYKPLADQIPAMSAAEQPQRPVTPAAAPNKDGILGRIGGALEVPLAMGTGMVGGVAGNLAGLYAGLTSGKFGTQAGVKVAEDRAGEVSNALTYQPRTQTGNKLLQTVGDAINDSGIMGVPLPELNALGRAAMPARNALADIAASGAAKGVDAGLAGANKLSSIIKPQQEPALSGVGAAATPEATLRHQRAADLPVPLRLSKGQAERNLEQQRFEIETAKMPEGAPLREARAKQNEQIAQNFDALIDDTGAQSSNLRAAGEIVNNAVLEKRQRIKAEVKSAYDAARDAGHMNQEINIKTLGDFLRDNAGSAENAPILKSIETQFTKKGKEVPPDRSLMLNSGPSDPLNRVISINDLEELRKQIRREIQPGTPNEAFGEQMIKLIDGATEGQGGDLYKSARALYSGYAAEFKNQSVVAKLLRTKPGTTDRAVAYEDVFKHSILDGSMDDVSAIRKTLLSGGEKGEQAWRELQGQTLTHMKEKMLENIAKDEAGNRIISPSKLDKVISGLDKDGKLETIFGKQGAAKLRDINELAQDVAVPIKEAGNHSNTAGVVIAAIDAMISANTGLPLPLGMATRYGVKKMKSNKLTKQVDEALNPLTDPKR